VLHDTKHVIKVLSFMPQLQILLFYICMPAMDTVRPQVDMLDTAGKMLERYLAMDSSFPSLVDVIQIAPQGTVKLVAIASYLLCAGLSVICHCIIPEMFVGTQLPCILMAFHLRPFESANGKNTATNSVPAINIQDTVHVLIYFQYFCNSVTVWYCEYSPVGHISVSCILIFFVSSVGAWSSIVG
jgi:hypothetical protein